MRGIEIDLDVHRRIEAARVSFEQSDNDILRDLLGLEGSQQAADRDTRESSEPAATLESAISIGQRTTGNWSVVFGSTVYIARNLREAYITAIASLAGHRPEFFEDFSHEGARRKFVARSAEELYPHSKHLAESRHNNWYKIGEWYVDLNLSSAQAAKRVRRACSLAGLQYGRDLVIKNGLEAL